MDGNIGNHLIAMNLILRPLEDINDPVWSVIISIIILLAGVFYVIVYILGTDERESHGSNGATESEELLQLPSDRDQQSGGRGHDRCDDRSGVRSLQEGEGESSGSGHTRKEN